MYISFFGTAFDSIRWVLACRQYAVVSKLSSAWLRRQELREQKQQDKQAKVLALGLFDAFRRNNNNKQKKMRKKQKTNDHLGDRKAIERSLLELMSGLLFKM